VRNYSENPNYYPDQINPFTSPQRFLPAEVRIFEAGKCSRLTPHGMPWNMYCEQPSKPGADFGYCEHHATERETE
jgi:hypothetical protein